ncbi:MAG: hypothetical protein KAR07_11645 [Spirochaetes bacterium]|nr:hypothetical protein [Spirochaetota bacterium]
MDYLYHIFRKDDSSGFTMTYENWVKLILFMNHPDIGDENFSSFTDDFRSENKSLWTIDKQDSKYIENTLRHLLLELQKTNDLDLIDDVEQIALKFDYEDEVLDWSGYTTGLMAIEYFILFCKKGAFIIKQIKDVFKRHKTIKEVRIAHDELDKSLKKDSDRHGFNPRQFMFNQMKYKPSKKWVGKYVKLVFGPGYKKFINQPVIILIQALKKTPDGKMYFVTHPSYTDKGHSELFLFRFNGNQEKRILSWEEAVPYSL